MATHGAEDIRRPLRRSRRLSHSQCGLTVYAQSAVVHAPSARSLPACPLQKNLQAQPAVLTPIPGLAPLRVAAHDLHPSCFSGIPPTCALPSSPVPVVAPRPLCTRSASAGAPRRSPRTARYANVAPTGVSKGPASLQSSSSSSPSSSSSSLVPVSSQCHGLCPLDAQLPLCQLDPLRFGTGLLGKRASSPQLSVYPTCPSPPKASVSRRGVVVTVTRADGAASPKASMPTNQSSPWSGAKLREAGSMVNGLTTQLTGSAAVPSSPTHTRAVDSDPLDKLPLCPPSNRCKGDGRAEMKAAAPSVVVPSQESNGDVLLSHVQIQSDPPSPPPPPPRPAAVTSRAQKVKSEVKLTTAIRKLARTSSARLSRTLNGYGATARSTGAMATASVPSRKSPLRSLTQREREPPTTGTNTGTVVPAENPSCDPCSPCSPAPLSPHHCAIPGETSPIGVPLPAPSVYSVTSDLSAIHLTRKGGAQAPPDDSCPSPSSPTGQDAAGSQPELEPKG